MSIHPNVMLMAILEPHDLPLKTARSIWKEHGISDRTAPITIGDGSKTLNGYVITVMNDDYDEDYQITANEGDLVVHGFMTYGYGESIIWDDLLAEKGRLEKWAKDICKRYKCEYSIHVAANYW